MAEVEQQGTGAQTAPAKKHWLLTTKGYSFLAGLWGGAAVLNSTNIVVNVIEVDPGGTLVSGVIAAINFGLAGHYVYLGHVKPLQEKNEQASLLALEPGSNSADR